MHVNQFKKYVRQVLLKPNKKLKQNELPFGYDEESRHLPKPTVFDIGKFIKQNMPRAFLGEYENGAENDQGEGSD